MDTVAQLEKHFGRPLNAWERVLTQSLFAVSILANRETDDFVLLHANSLPLPEHVQAEYTLRGLAFAGAIGLSWALTPEVELTFPLSANCIAGIAQAFMKMMKSGATQVKDGGALSLYRLWNLKDERPN
jgi:hypothetical protein